MSQMTDTSGTDKRLRWPMIFAVALLLIELTGIATVFKHGIDFECLAHWPSWACRNASLAAVSIYCLIGMVALLFMLRPAPQKTLIQNAGERLWPLLINFAGVGVAMTPFALLSGADGASGVVPSLAMWIVGMALILIGLGLYIAPLPRWTAYAASEWKAFLPVVFAAAIAPNLSIKLQPIWSIDWIADQTFNAVTWILSTAGYDLYSESSSKVIGAGDFFIRVAKVCSGIEGIALVTLFVSLYLWLFRQDLRFPLAFLLYPLGIATSVAFNILRISILLFIGLEGNPELAVGGFHSHAGWMMFTLVALGVIGLAQTVPALRKTRTTLDTVTGQNALPPFWKDPMVAQILPFAVFMLSALFASTLSQTPSAVYPIRVVLMIAVLAMLLPFYRALPWRIDPVAVAVGAFVAAYWVLIPVEASDAPVPYGQLTGALLVLWIIARGFGTMVLIPVIEEAFFRGYLEKRLRFGTSPAFMIGAAVVTAILFAALHGRWAEAFVASLLFSWIAWRKGNLTDAIISHAVANALIFAAAVITGNLAMI